MQAPLEVFKQNNHQQKSLEMSVKNSTEDDRTEQTQPQNHPGSQRVDDEGASQDAHFEAQLEGAIELPNGMHNSGERASSTAVSTRQQPIENKQVCSDCGKVGHGQSRSSSACS